MADDEQSKAKRTQHTANQRQRAADVMRLVDDLISISPYSDDQREFLIAAGAVLGIRLMERRGE